MTGATKKEVQAAANDAVQADLLEKLLRLDKAAATSLLEKWLSSRTEVYQAAVQLTSQTPMNTQEFATTPSFTNLAVQRGDSVGSMGSAGSAISASRRKLQRVQTSIKDNAVPIVQFGAPIFFASEEKEFAEIAIIRVGDISEASRVDYTTQDAQAKAGVKYVAQSGSLFFAPNEGKKEINVQIIQDDAWDTTMEFKVKLLTEGRENCILGTYLHQCRVKIIDNDMFPTNKYDEDLKNQNYSEINSAGLLLEYFKMNLSNKVVRTGVIKALIADQVKNVYSIVRLLVNIILVDKILCSEVTDDCTPAGAEMKLLAVVLILFSFFPVIHWLDFRKVYWKIGGASRKTLQANLLRKFLNYNEHSRNEVDMHELLMAMSRDVQAIVQNGFAKLMPLLGAVSRLLLILLYQLTLPFILGTEFPSAEGWASRLYPTFLFPPIMIGFLLLRKNRTVGTLRDMFEAEDEMMHDVAQTVSNYRLIADYKVRQFFVDRFDVTIGHYNKAFVNAGAVKVNNLQFAPWLTLVMSSAYMVYGGLKVTQGSLTLGQYLNTFGVINEIGKMWGEIFKLLLEMQDTFPNMETLSTYMNLETDVTHRMHLADQDHDIGDELVEKLATPRGSSRGLAVNQLPLVLRNITLTQTGDYYLPPVNIQLQQGKLYAIMGLAGHGKSTLLKTIGNALLPDFNPESKCVCYIPTHLKTLHVSLEPMFFKGTLKENMKFATSGEDASDKRIEKICKMIGLPKYIIDEVLATDGRVERFWVQHYSQTELVMLSLARAMITNPAVLCVHKPTICFQDDVSDVIFHVLNEFVQHRGLEQPPEQFHQREQRTCILTAARVSAAQWAEAVIHVAPKGIRVLDPAELTHDDLAELCGHTPELEQTTLQNGDNDCTYSGSGRTAYSFV